jgi:hypothetical protein
MIQYTVYGNNYMAGKMATRRANPNDIILGPEDLIDHSMPFNIHNLKIESRLIEAANTIIFVDENKKSHVLKDRYNEYL